MVPQNDRHFEGHSTVISDSIRKNSEPNTLTKIKNINHNSNNKSSDASYIPSRSPSGSSNISSVSENEIQDIPEFAHSSEDIAKYLTLYNNTGLSARSSVNCNQPSGPSINVSNTSKKYIRNDPSLDSKNNRDLKDILSTTTFGTKQSRVHAQVNYDKDDDDLEDMSWRTSLTMTDSVFTDATDDSHLYHQTITDHTPFISKTDLMDQVISKRLRTLDPSHVKLDKVREGQGYDVDKVEHSNKPNKILAVSPSMNPAASDASGGTYTVRTKNASAQSSDASSFEDSSRVISSALSVGSTQSTQIGYWKVKPTESNLNISVEKCLNLEPTN